MREFCGSGVIRRRHAGELGRVVGAAADDDDAGRPREVVEQRPAPTRSGRGGSRRTSSRRRRRSIRCPTPPAVRRCTRSRAAAAAPRREESVAKARTDCSDARSNSSTVHRSGSPICATASAPRATSRTASTRCHDGSAASSARAHSSPRPALAPVMIAVRVFISPPTGSGVGPSLSDAAVGTCARCPSRRARDGRPGRCRRTMRWRPRRVRQTRAPLSQRDMPSGSRCVTASRNRRDRSIADPADDLGDGGIVAALQRQQQEKSQEGGMLLLLSDDRGQLLFDVGLDGDRREVPLGAAFHDCCQHPVLRSEMPVDRTGRQATGLADVTDRRRRVPARGHQRLGGVEDLLAGLLALLLLLRRHLFCKDHYRQSSYHYLAPRWHAEPMTITARGGRVDRPLPAGHQDSTATARSSSAVAVSTRWPSSSAPRRSSCQKTR